MAAPPAVLIGIQADTTVAVRTGTGGGARCWEDRVAGRTNPMAPRRGLSLK